MNRALIWLQGNAPDALQAVHPKVLRWWTSPRPQYSDMWILLAFISWITVSLWTAERLKSFNLSGWIWFLIMPIVIVTSAVLGYNLARGLAWLRVVWVVRLYLPWSVWDRKLARRIPGLRRWVDSRDIGPTRDLLPVLALYVFELRGFLLHEEQVISPIWQYMVVALFPTIFVGIFWRGGIRMLAGAPGAKNWLALQKARVRS